MGGGWVDAKEGADLGAIEERDPGDEGLTLKGKNNLVYSSLLETQMSWFRFMRVGYEEARSVKSSSEAANFMRIEILLSRYRHLKIAWIGCWRGIC